MSLKQTDVILVVQCIRRGLAILMSGSPKCVGSILQKAKSSLYRNTTIESQCNVKVSTKVKHCLIYTLKQNYTNLFNWNVIITFINGHAVYFNNG